MTTMYGNPNSNYEVSNGTTYSSNATGQIADVLNAQDQKDLVLSGCVLQASVQAAGNQPVIINLTAAQIHTLHSSPLLGIIEAPGDYRHFRRHGYIRASNYCYG